MFPVACSILENVIEGGYNYSMRGDATIEYQKVTSFDFVILLHLMKEIMGITDVLCQYLQQKSQDIINVMHLL